MLTASCVLPAAGANLRTAEVKAETLPDVMPPPSSLQALTPEAEAQWEQAAGKFDAPSAAPALPFQHQGGPEDQSRAADCLAKAVYYEARSESEEGQRAVAQVVLNRVRHPAFPASVCGVVFQGSTRRTGCQFSFTCDGAMARRPQGWAWERARRIADAALNGEVYTPVGNATHYHTTAILPYWAPSLSRSAVIGAHVFYRWRGAQGRSAAFRQAYSGDENARFVRASAWRPDDVSSAQSDEPSAVKRLSFDTGTVRIHRGTTQIESKPDAGKVAPPESFGVRIHRGAPAES
ncbi:cell wall hydrolase [Allosphingosinicella sp.]|uniref:cell wall hydrolase n=1 Tax=Allosphingosinicella sp. TaxID=2823234 RepID=UPI0039C85C90